MQSNINSRFKYMIKGSIESKKTVILACRVLPSEVIEKIYNIAFPAWTCCSCNNVICFLCKYACCENAQAVFCVCLLCTKCPTHGTKCYGTHD